MPREGDEIAQIAVSGSAWSQLLTVLSLQVGNRGWNGGPPRVVLQRNEHPSTRRANDSVHTRAALKAASSAAELEIAGAPNQSIEPKWVRLFFVDGPRGFCQRHGKSYLTRRRRGGEGGGGGLLTGRPIPSAYRWAWCPAGTPVSWKSQYASRSRLAS